MWYYHIRVHLVPESVPSFNSTVLTLFEAEFWISNLASLPTQAPQNPFHSLMLDGFIHAIGWSFRATSFVVHSYLVSPRRRTASSLVASLLLWLVASACPICPFNFYLNDFLLNSWFLQWICILFPVVLRSFLWWSKFPTRKTFSCVGRKCCNHSSEMLVNLLTLVLQ